MTLVLVSRDTPSFLQYSYYFYSFSGVSSATVVVLLVFIVKTDGQRGITSILSPFNIALLACGLSITGTLISQGKSFEIAQDCSIAGLDYVLDKRAIVCNLVKFCATAGMETSYVYYSWKRAGGVIDRVFPRTGKYFHFLCKISPYIFFFQIAPLVVRLFIPTQQVRLLSVIIPLVLSILSGVFAVLIDFILMTAFVMFVRRTRYGDFQDADPKFVLISKYGIAGISQAFVALVGFTVFGVTGSSIALLLTYIFFYLTFCILGTMKWALWRNEAHERLVSVNSRGSDFSRPSKTKVTSGFETKSIPKSLTSSAHKK